VSRLVAVTFDVVDLSGNRAAGSANVTVSDGSAGAASGVGAPSSGLTGSGPIQVSQNNTIIAGLDIAGEVKVLNGVQGTIIRNTRITVSGGIYAVDCRYSGSAGPVKFENVTVISSPSANTAAVLNLSAGSSVVDSHLSGSKQSVNGSLSGVLLRNTLMDGIVNVSGSAHCENIYSAGADGLQVIGCTLLNPLSQTANIFLDGKGGAFANVVIEGNVLAGGGYCIYGGSTATTSLTVRSNVFDRRYFPNGGCYGTRAYMPSGAALVWDLNTWDDGTSC
jgi:hypothetical protein